MTDKSREKEAKEALVQTQKVPKLVPKLIVMRLGGSSIGSPQAIEMVAKRIKEKVAKGGRIVALVSAIPREREESLSFIRTINPQTPGRLLNSLIFACDFKSVPSLAAALEKIGVPTFLYNGSSVNIKLQNGIKGRPHYEVGVDYRVVGIIKKVLEKGQIFVCSGFKVIEGEDKIDNAILRDSNASAVVLAGWLKADFCEINTSRDGIYYVDPLIVPNAKRIDFLNYAQMRCFSHLGARILSRRCVDLAADLGVVIKVQLSPALGKSSGGTIIGPVKLENSGEEIGAGIAIQSKVVQLKFFLPAKLDVKHLFRALADFCLIDSGLNHESESYLIVVEEDCENIIKRINNFKKVKIKEERGFASLSLIDLRMMDASGYIDRILQALDKILVRLNSAGDSITVIVKEEDMAKAASKLAKTFNLVE